MITSNEPTDVVDNHKDYRLHIKLQNANVMRLMTAHGFKNVAQLAKAIGMQPTALGQLVNMRISALTSKGNYRQCVLRLCKALCCEPDDLFNDQQKTTGLERNVAFVDVSNNTLRRLIDRRSGTGLLEDEIDAETLAMTVRNAVNRLTRREAQVLNLRFGLNDSEDLSLEVVGEKLGVSRDRVRQIESKALRKLRHPSRGRALLTVSRPELSAADVDKWFDLEPLVDQPAAAHPSKKEQQWAVFKAACDKHYPLKSRS